MFIMIMATVVDVFCRKLIGQSYPGATEIVQYLLTAVVYFGVGYCAIERGMITIDLFKPNIVCTVFNNVVSIAAGLVVAYASVIQAMQSYAVGGSSLRLQLPKWPFMLITAFGFLVMCVILALHTVEDIKAHRAMKRGDDTPPMPDSGKGGSAI